MIFDFMLPNIEEIKKAHELRDTMDMLFSDTKIIELFVRMKKRNGEDFSEELDLFNKCQNYRISRGLPLNDLHYFSDEDTNGTSITKFEPIGKGK